MSEAWARSIEIQRERALAQLSENDLKVLEMLSEGVGINTIARVVRTSAARVMSLRQFTSLVNRNDRESHEELEK